MSAARPVSGAGERGQNLHILYLASPGCAVWLGAAQDAAPALPHPAPAGTPARQPASSAAQPAAQTGAVCARTGSPEASSVEWLAYLSIRLGLPPGLPRGSIHRRRLAGFLIFSVGAPQPRSLHARRKARRAASGTGAAQEAGAPRPPERVWRAAQAGPVMVALRLPARLTPDQRAVYELLVRGLTNTQIAARLHRKRRWVCYRVAEIKRLVGIEARSELLKRKAVLLYNR